MDHCNYPVGKRTFLSCLAYLLWIMEYTGAYTTARLFDPHLVIRIHADQEEQICL